MTNNMLEGLDIRQFKASTTLFPSKDMYNLKIIFTHKLYLMRLVSINLSFYEDILQELMVNLNLETTS